MDGHTFAPAAARLEARTAELETVDPGYVGRVRAAATRIGRRGGAGLDVSDALACLEDVATIDVEVPTLSRSRAGRVAKTGLKRAMAWYLRYVGQQVTVLGHAVVRLGTLLNERTEYLDVTTSRLDAEATALEQRVSRLEADRPAANRPAADRPEA